MHVPVQSGSDKVLNDMKRKYQIEHFEQVCDYLLEHVPRVHIATDFICGFPTEDEEDHEQSMRVLDKYKFSTLNISQFYPRPKTPAARMKKLDTKIVKNRSRAMTKLFKSYVNFGDRIGEEHNVLITEMAKDLYHFVGHGKCFDHFLVPPPSKGTDIDLMGKFVKVKIISVGKFFIKSKIVKIPQKSDEFWVDNGLEKRKKPNPHNDRNNYVYLFALLISLVAILTAVILRS